MISSRDVEVLDLVGIGSLPDPDLELIEIGAARDRRSDLLRNLDAPSLEDLDYLR